jgi:RNA polymerase sigma factor (sigma-70 family)
MFLNDSKTGYYTRMYAEYYPVVYNVFYSRIKNSDAASDLCQELFIRYYEKFETVENHRRWIFASVKFLLLEYYRSTKREEYDTDYIVEAALQTCGHDNEDTKLIIADALESIDNFGEEKNRTLFSLIALYDYTYEEAGKSLGMSRRQARYRFSLVVDKLMDHFRKKGIHGLEDIL